jgi:hypothetical protein
MVETQTETNASPSINRDKLPAWYSVMVCLGSAGVGGYFGAFYGAPGIIVTAAGGAGVALLWLQWIDRLSSCHVIVRFLAGIGAGSVVGVIDAFWMHLVARGFGYGEGIGVLQIGLPTILRIASVVGAVAGAIYGLFCMIVLQVYRVCSRREQ